MWHISTKRILAAVEADDNLGFCTACGEEAFGVEPDACGYTCESCDEPAVYGAQELLLLGGVATQAPEVQFVILPPREEITL